eukprot:1069445-Pleurochrysis_carterae.AAC.1
MYTDDPVIAVVGVDRALRALRVFSHVDRRPQPPDGHTRKAHARGVGKVAPGPAVRDARHHRDPESQAPPR